MSLQTLLRNFGEDGPSGDNLEYDQAFIEMELAAQPGEERQMGDEVIAAAEPDYAEVSAKAMAVLERSHDLRAAVTLALAQLRLKGLPGFAEVTAYMRACLEDYWDTCHPQLDADDDDDPTMRVNAVRALTDAGGVLRALRLAPLTQSRTFGRFNLRDIAIAEGEVPAPDGGGPVPEASAIAAAFQDTDPAQLQALHDAAKAAAADVDAIVARFDAMVPGLGPDLDPLRKTLRQAVKRLADATGGSAEEEAAAEADEAPATGRPAAPRGGAVGGINGPNDVINALDRIIDYYARHEPSSPIPILLTRAKRLVNADFMTIVRDMAPSGVENVNLIGGLSDEGSY
jgi:type VI secretion system protein ImpA